MKEKGIKFNLFSLSENAKLCEIYYENKKEEQMELKFNVGDQVKVIGGFPNWGNRVVKEEIGTVQTIRRIEEDNPPFYLLENYWYPENSLELVEANTQYKEGDIVLVEAKIIKVNKEYAHPYEVINVGSKTARGWIGRDSIKQLVSRLPSPKEPEIIYGYKVVYEDLEGDYHSVIYHSESFSVQYPLFSKAVPKEGYPPYLFAFDSYENADQFGLIGHGRERILYSVLCIHPNEKLLLSELGVLPKGTRLCKWILPIEAKA